MIRMQRPGRPNVIVRYAGAILAETRERNDREEKTTQPNATAKSAGATLAPIQTRRARNLAIVRCVNAIPVQTRMCKKQRKSRRSLIVSASQIRKSIRKRAIAPFAIAINALIRKPARKNATVRSASAIPARILP